MFFAREYKEKKEKANVKGGMGNGKGRDLDRTEKGGRDNIIEKTNGRDVEKDMVK